MLRWMLRPDARLALAGIGVAAALLIPLAGTLALSTLDAKSPVAPGWVLVRPDGGPIDLATIPTPDQAVRTERGADRLLTAYVVGAPGVKADEAQPMPLASRAALPGFKMKAPALQAQPLVSSHATLVHPSRLADNSTADMLYARTAALRDRLVAQGLVATSGDGVHSFVTQSITQVRGASIALTAASVPVVALIAMAFAELDASEMSRTAAVVAALGHPARARALLVGRVLAVIALAALVAILVAIGLYLLGRTTFHPTPIPWRALALALGLPTAAAVAFGAWRSAMGVRRAGGLLRAPSQEISPSRRLPRISPTLQPLVLGTRMLPAIALAGLLFVVDVGFPLAVAAVPQALTGSSGELVRTSGTGSLLNGRTDARVADVAAFDPAISAVVAEVLVPTLVRGQPVLVRGGNWDALSGFHGLRLSDGEAPEPGEIAVGAGLGRRLGVHPGDRLEVAASTRPLVRTFTVSGVFVGSDLLRSEAILPMGDAQDLAGLRADQATLVRARPDSDEAMAALSRTGADVRVVSLALNPPEPAAGTIATATVGLANLGPLPGSRLLFVRVDGQAVAQLDVRVAGHTQTTAQASFVVPRAGFRLEVNPTVEVETAASTVTLSAPALQFDDAAVTVTARSADSNQPIQGLEIALYPNATAAQAGAPRLQVAVTESDGTASFPGVRPGLWVAAATQGSRAATEVRVASAENATEGRLIAERVWLQPGNPAPGETAAAFARLANVGGVQATATVAILVDDRIVGLRDVTLAPGATLTIDAPLVVDSGTHALSVLERRISFQTAASSASPAAGAGPAAPLVGMARRSDTLARSAADEALGNARAVLLGLGGTAMASSLALVYLAVARTVHHRRGILPTLWSLGMEPEQLRRRAALEAGLMGLVAGLAAALAGALLFALAGILQWPQAFGHSVPQPIDPIFSLQAATAFAAACGIATYVTLGRLVAPESLRRPGAETNPPLPPASLPEILGGQVP